MKIIILLLIITLSMNVNANGFSAYGMSDLSCGKYINDITTDSEAKNLYSWWVAGFVSGTNLEKGRALTTDASAHEAWLNKYCSGHPLATFMKAAIELNKELENRRR